MDVSPLLEALHQAADAWRKSHALHDPDWEPLEELLGPCRAGEGGSHSPACSFMFMGMVAGPPGSGGIRLYKHGISRRYLNLDERGKAYRYDPRSDSYRPVPLGEALQHVFGPLAEMGESVFTPYDEDYVSRRDEALRRAGFIVLSADISSPTADESAGT